MLLRRSVGVFCNGSQRIGDVEKQEAAAVLRRTPDFRGKSFDGPVDHELLAVFPPGALGKARKVAKCSSEEAD